MRKIHKILIKHSVLYFVCSLLLFTLSFSADLFFIYKNINGLLPIFLYALSFLLLILFIDALIIMIGRLRQISLDDSNIAIVRNLKDYHFRTSFFSTIALVMNILLALFHFLLYSFYHSSFQLVIGEYLLLLAIIRLFIILVYYKYRSSKLYDHLYLFTGVNIIALNLLLVYVIYKLTTNGKVVSYHQYIAYLFALYAFIKLSLGIGNFVKSHLKKERITICLRNLGIIDALVTMLSLTNCLLNLNDEFENGVVIISILALVVIIFSTILGIRMIVKEFKSHGKV